MITFAIALWLILAPPAQAQSYILCHRDVDLTAVNPSPTSAEDACSGTVLIQGISYQCGALSEVDSKRSEFFEELRKGGGEFCSSYCAKRGSKCRGTFTEPTECGYTIETGKAQDFGEHMAVCNPECGGQAFAYCSIYHSSMLRVDPALFKGMKPNCECKAAK